MQLVTAQWGGRSFGTGCGRGNCPFCTSSGFSFALAPGNAAAGVVAEPIAVTPRAIAKKVAVLNMTISCGWGD
jgi:hypothetical protein